MIRGNIEIAIRMLRKLCIRLREAERKVAEIHPTTTRQGGVATAQPTSQKAQAPAGTGARLEVRATAPPSAWSTQTLIDDSIR